jgi:hypothetical protein
MAPTQLGNKLLVYVRAQGCNRWILIYGRVEQDFEAKLGPKRRQNLWRTEGVQTQLGEVNI